jgi:signal transduction histidine kinase
VDPVQSLREKLAFYEEQFPGFHFRQSADWSFQHVDPRVRSGLGLEPESIQRHGEHFFARIHPKDRARYWDGLLRFAESEATRTLRFRLIDEAGETTHHVLEVRQPQRLQSGLLLGYSGVWFDVSLQAGLEAQVAFQSWQRSLGQLTRILLHDFRNAMTGLQTLLELYARQTEEDHPWSEGFKLMLSTTLRTQQTVERLSYIVRDEPQEDSILSLRSFLSGEHAFWVSLWSRPVEFVGYDALPEDFLIEVDATTLRRFWLQFLLLYRPMEDEINRIEFTWRPLQEGDWIVGDAFPFGLRAAQNGLHLALQPCPSPFAGKGAIDQASREWPNAEWRQLHEFAEILKLQMAFSPNLEDPRNGVLHLFWPANVPSRAGREEVEGIPQMDLPAHVEPHTTLRVLLVGEWERPTVFECIECGGFEPLATDRPPTDPVHGVVFLDQAPDRAWLEWLESEEAAHHVVYVHPVESETPAQLPETVFTLPSRLPENRILLELQLQELMR